MPPNKAATNASDRNETSHLAGTTSCSDVIYEYLPPLWQTDFVVAVIYCVLVGVALLLGTFGNLIILLVSLTTRAMNTVGKDFLINLALADLCVALVADPMCILGVIKGQEWFKGQWILCEVVSSMCLTACLCSFLSLSMLAVNRYVYVCHNKAYFSIYTRPISVTLCLLCWVFAFLFQFPNLIGWGDHTFDTKSHQCIWDRTADFSYTIFVTGGLIGLPLLLMGMCFILIFKKIWKSKFDVFSLNLDDPLRLRRTWLEAVRSSKTLFCVFLVFIICWTPYAVITAVDVSDEFSMEKHLFVTLLAHYHSALNIVIYTASNKAFRRSAIDIITCAKKRMHKASSESQTKTNTGKSSEFKTFYADPVNREYLTRKGMTYFIGSDEDMKTTEYSEENTGTDQYDGREIGHETNHM